MASSSAPSQEASQSSPTQIRALRVTRDGLLYAASYDMDQLAERMKQLSAAGGSSTGTGGLPGGCWCKYASVPCTSTCATCCAVAAMPVELLAARRASNVGDERGG